VQEGLEEQFGEDAVDVCALQGSGGESGELAERMQKIFEDQVLASENRVRDDLKRGDIGVTSTGGNEICKVVGQRNPGCTNVGGLRDNTIQGLKNLKKECNCEVTIVGGTEWWFHGNKSIDIEDNETGHKPKQSGGGRTIDLRINDGLTLYFTSKTDPPGSTVFPSDCKRKTVKNFGKVTAEGSGCTNDPHWHIKVNR